METGDTGHTAVSLKNILWYAEVPLTAAKRFGIKIGKQNREKQKAIERYTNTPLPTCY